MTGRPLGHIRDLQQFLAVRPGPARIAIILFDSLDRLPEPTVFKTLVEDDIKALKAAGIGVVVVGPVRFMVGCRSDPDAQNG